MLAPIESRFGSRSCDSIVICSIILAQNFATGQRTSASISGVATDPIVAVITGAAITATDAAKGTVVTAETNDKGFCVVSNLPPSTHKVRAEASGFQSYEQTGITLQVGQPASISRSKSVLKDRKLWFPPRRPWWRSGRRSRR